MLFWTSFLFVRVTGTLPSTVRLSQAGSLLRGRMEIPNNFRVIFLTRPQILSRMREHVRQAKQGKNIKLGSCFWLSLDKFGRASERVLAGVREMQGMWE